MTTLTRLTALRPRFERLLEAIVLVLVAALAVVVVMGVGFRKFGAALVWYDEVASILLAWLTYYGAALAALKRAHIGFPNLVRRLGRPWRIPVVVAGEAVVVAFFLIAAWAGWRVLVILEGSGMVSLPWVPTRLTQSVIPIGSVLFVIAQLMSLPEMLRAGEGADPDEGTVGAASDEGIDGGMSTAPADPARAARDPPADVPGDDRAGDDQRAHRGGAGGHRADRDGVTSGAAAIPNAGLVLFTGATSFPLIAIPLFILAGAIMNATGISRRLIAFASALFGAIRGGLAMVSISASLFFAEISGSAVADVAALGSILIPAMKKRGYSTPFAAAVTSSSATLAVIIPPSIPMIIYGVMSESSIVELFVAGVIPGVVGGILLMAVAYVLALRNGFPVEHAFELRRVWTTFRDAGWALLLPVIILGGIFTGWVTATEGAGWRWWPRWWWAGSSTAKSTWPPCAPPPSTAGHRPRWSCCWWPPRRCWATTSPRPRSRSAWRTASSASLNRAGPSSRC